MAPIPTSNGLPERPYSIKKTWVIGGAGNWDYLTMDAAAHLLYIAHGPAVQVVDVETGTVKGVVSGFGEAHTVVLDPNGQVGYVSDGFENGIHVFDRSTFQILHSIAVGCSPRSIAFEPQTSLLFAICGATPAPPASPARRRTSPPTHPSAVNAEQTPQPATGTSHVLVINAEAQRILADIVVGGDFHVAQADGNGQVYVTVGASEEKVDPRQSARRSWPPRIARLDAGAIAADAYRELDAQPHSDAAQPHPANWQEDVPGALHHVRFLRVDQDCHSPQGLAVDGRSQRLFVGCGDQTLAVLNAESGAMVTKLTTGPGTDAIAYDASRGLIYTANGGGYGSVTVIQQDLNDSYTVVQNLATMQQARTMAVDPSTGQVYLVTTLYGANLKNPPAQGIGTLKINAVDGTFQVLVIGN
jgi:DNA-binding beta-propeller fold protein YncE